MKRLLCPMVAALIGSVMVVPSTQACSVCYGEPDSPTTRGLSWAIIVLAGIVGVVLTGVAAFFVHMNRRAGAPEQAMPEVGNSNLPG